jgi:hypothetical protein
MELPEAENNHALTLCDDPNGRYHESGQDRE